LTLPLILWVFNCSNSAIFFCFSFYFLAIKYNFDFHFDILMCKSFRSL
jgi:hypothetical protein